MSLDPESGVRCPTSYKYRLPHLAVLSQRPGNRDCGEGGSYDAPHVQAVDKPAKYRAGRGLECDVARCCSWHDGAAPKMS